MKVVILMALVIAGFVLTLLIPRRFRFGVVIFAVLLNLFQPALAVVFPVVGEVSFWCLFPSLGVILAWALTSYMCGGTTSR